MPFHVVMLNRKLCTKCTMPLEKVEKRVSLENSKVGVVCKCNNKYIYNTETGVYRKASDDEKIKIEKSL